MIKTHLDLPMVLLGREVENPMAEAIVDSASCEGLHNLIPSGLSLGLLKATVRAASLLVTNDTGTRHIAIAFDRPVITLFGPTDEMRTENYFEKERTVAVDLDCRPCQKRICPTDHRCMQGLTPERVFDAVRELLQTHPAKRPDNDEERD